MEKFKPKTLLEYNKESIITEIKRVYQKYFKNKKMHIREFNKFSRVKGSTIIKKFGSWNNALKLAGIDNCKSYADEIKSDIKKVICKRQPFFPIPG